MVILKLILLFLILGLFLYSKLLPHALILNPNTNKIFLILDRIFKPIISFTSGVLPLKWEIGSNGLKLDLSQIVVFTILILIYLSL